MASAADLGERPVRVKVEPRLCQIFQGFLSFRHESQSFYPANVMIARIERLDDSR
jgi:hypothetical protein